MRSKKLSVGSIFLLAVFAVFQLMMAPRAAAQAEKVLHSFHDYNGTDGYAPYAGLIADTAGNLYGTTFDGGPYGGGTAFKLTPNASGGWAETVIYAFGNGTDGTFPSASLILDAAGNLYGTTSQGNGADGYGIAFELTPAASGYWTETVLHVFGNDGDGSHPSGGLVFDAAGNLYGATVWGGTGNCGGNGSVCGTVYELTLGAVGSWTEKVLLYFDLGTGFNPTGSLTIDAAGNLYGTTVFGGAAGNGVAFELGLSASGIWRESVLHAFGNRTDGYLPSAGLIFDAAGNLYGTTERGGNSTNCGDGESCGTVFALVSKAGGGWSEKIMHNFSDNGEDGTVPVDGLIFGPSGNLYGTTLGGGIYNNGVVFELKP